MLAGLVAFLTVAGVGLVAARPALAAEVSLADTIGVGRFGDTRVLDVAGTGNGSRVQTAAYQVGLQGARVDRQRWTFERVNSAGRTFAYRIRNQASGRCLDKATQSSSAGAIVQIWDCTGAANQLWWVPTETHPDGFTLRNGADNRCLDITGASPQIGVGIQVWGCLGSWNQRWQRRTGSFDCGVRDREWLITRLCIRAEEPISGVFASWPQNPVQMAWLDPNRYVLSNTVQTYMSLVHPTVYGGVEYGWRAERSTEPTGGISYNLYLSEWSTSRLEYTVVPGFVAPESTVASSARHPHFLLPTGVDAQWELWYDYNPITTTELQVAGDFRSVRTGLAIRYMNVVTLPTAFVNQAQLATGGFGLRRPYLREVATGEAKTCDAPPSWADWGYGAHGPGGADLANRPPWCITTVVGVQGNPEDTDAAVDYVGIGKPGTAPTVVRGAPAPASGAEPGPDKAGSGDLFHGVDQKTLAACLRTDPNACVRTVPGLAACVRARQSCNRAAKAAAPPRPKARGSAMSADQARHAALRVVAFETAAQRASVAAGAGELSVRTVAPAADQVLARRVAAGTDAVHVVTGSGRVRGPAVSADRAYDGFTVVYDARSGALLHACLGSTCPRLG